MEPSFKIRFRPGTRVIVVATLTGQPGELLGRRGTVVSTRRSPRDRHQVAYRVQFGELGKWEFFRDELAAEVRRGT